MVTFTSMIKSIGVSVNKKTLQRLSLQEYLQREDLSPEVENFILGVVLCKEKIEAARLQRERDLE